MVVVEGLRPQLQFIEDAPLWGERKFGIQNVPGAEVILLRGSLERGDGNGQDDNSSQRVSFEICRINSASILFRC